MERVAAGDEARRALQALQNFGGVVGGGAQEGEAAFKWRLRRLLGLLLPPSHLRMCMTKPRRLVPCRIAAGLSKCAASFLSAAPVVRAFAIGEGTFTRSLQRLFEVQRHRPCADPPGARVKGFLRRRTGCT